MNSRLPPILLFLLCASGAARRARPTAPDAPVYQNAGQENRRCAKTSGGGGREGR